jgi:D-alanyl-D-alanine carboxypeptidase
MRPKFLFIFVFYTLLFLFYPGDSFHFHIFSYNRPVFNKQEVKKPLKLSPLPYLKTQALPYLSAQGIYVVYLPSFTPILEKNSHQKFLPASTAKIISALVTYDIYKPEQIIEVKETIDDGQLMGLVLGEKITVENLIYGLLVHSGNDAAYVLAQNFGYQKFVDLMNQKAKELKMKNTHFTDPAGLNEDQNQYTTPFDLTLAGRVILNHPYLSKMVAVKEITVPDVDFKYFHRLVNVNKLLGEVSGVGGIKTGYTQEAGQNLVSFYKKNGHQFIIVVLKSENRFLDTENIIDWIEWNIDFLPLE